MFIFLNFVSAAIQVVSPANFTNASGRIMINFTYANTSADIIAPALENTTFYFNNVAVPVNNFTCLANSCNATLNTSVVADIAGRNLSVILGNDTTLKPADANASFILIDNTKPVVNPGNISSPVNVGNYSSTIFLNVTVTDATALVRAVIFNITNSTGVQNATYAGTREGTTNQYSISINTSHFYDVNGTFNITVFANDTTIGGNLNNSARVYSLRFDNTQPSVSLTCSPNPVSEQATITCSCTVNDLLSGVNASRTAFTTNPSTSSTGTFTTECTGADMAGNAKTDTLSYTVSSSSGGSSGGGSGGSSGGDTASGTNPIATKTVNFASIAPSTLAIITSLGEKYGLKKIGIGVNTNASNVRLTINAYNSKPVGVLAKNGQVYKYLEISAQNLDGKLKGALFNVQVSKAWLSSSNLNKGEISLFKFKNDEWIEIPTVYKSEDSKNYYYDSTSDSFSFFAVGEKVEPVAQSPEVEATPQEEEVNQVVGGELPEKVESSKINFATIIWIILVIIIVIVIVATIYKKRH